jgi:MFS family permease
VQNHQDQVKRFFPINFSVFFVAGIAALSGFTVLGAASLMPALIHEMSLRNPGLVRWENSLATAVAVCFWGLSSITSFASSGLSESRTRRKPLFLAQAALARLAFPLIVVVTFFSTRMDYRLFVALLLLSITWWGLLNGTLMPQWFDYIGRLIPVNRRGILFGGRDSVGTLLGVGLLAMFPAITRRFAFPADYGVMFSIGAVLLLLSYVPYLFLREIPYELDELRPKRPWSVQIRDTLGILAQDPAYRRFLIASAALGLASLASPSLYTLKAINMLGLAGAEAATFSSRVAIVTTFGYAIFMPLFGVLADRIGYKKVAYLAYSLQLASYALIIFATTKAMFLGAVFLVGVLQGGAVLVAVNFGLEFAPENRRPSYQSLRSLFTLPFVFMPLLGGLMADRLGHNTVFVVAGVILAGGLTLFAATVRDPRREKTLDSRRFAPEPFPEG